MADNNNNNTYTIGLKGAEINARLNNVPDKLNKLDDTTYRLKVAEMASGPKAAVTREYVDNSISAYTVLNKTAKTLEVNKQSINYIDDTFFSTEGCILYAKAANTPAALLKGDKGQFLKILSDGKLGWGEESKVDVATKVGSGNAITKLDIDATGQIIIPTFGITFTTASEFDTEKFSTVHKADYSSSGAILYGNPGASGPGSYGTVALGIGNPGQILMVDESYKPIWKSESALTSVLFKSAYTAKGDILVGSGDTNKFSTVSIGDTGDILKVSNGTAVWGSAQAPLKHSGKHHQDTLAEDHRNAVERAADAHEGGLALLVERQHIETVGGNVVSC